MVRRYVPEAGDIVWRHFDPQAGHRVVRKASRKGKVSSVELAEARAKIFALIGKVGIG